ncbi:hypothetical protein FANTH_2515 [Fusarium anthophilum]|uniref:Uncharacterized protein n=1 Tax=Fusarium anthophilum TaxID=48485 RepID=A0A8H5E9Z6_9HYPO|nr:hypothetical protein FANTH_2515 [Fusarium anthophilum]
MDGFELEKIRNCRIILVVGPRGADHGTILPTLIYGEINNESFAFLDSPGFGHAASQPGAVKRQIHAMLGHFTKEFGGIHGILYIQDILTERETPGMQEATYFLRELTG